MAKMIAFISVVAASAATAADRPFWGEDNSAGTNVTASVSANSASTGRVDVRTVSTAEAGPIAFSSRKRGIVASFR